MQTSEQINELATALSKAQATIIGAVKDSANPFFKSSYADLASVLDAARKPLTDNGLCLIQGVSTGDGAVHVTSLLAHSSGQWVKSTISLVPADWKPQTVGGCATYGRRYGGAAIIGVAQIDDDGNAASGRGNGNYADPRGDLGKQVDTKVANKWAKALISNQDEDHRLADTWNEIKDDHDLAVAVWAAIPNTLKQKIKQVTGGGAQ
jgi:hypothetical protein